MPKLNQRQELFAHGVAMGKSTEQAYADAGYNPNRHNASRLLNTNENISLRVKQLQGKAEERLVVSKEMVVAGLLKEAQATGKGTSQGARVQAWNSISKVLGYTIDRKIIGIKRLEDMDDSELHHLAGQLALPNDATEGGPSEGDPLEGVTPAGRA